MPCNDPLNHYILLSFDLSSHAYLQNVTGMKDVSVLKRIGKFYIFGMVISISNILEFL